MISKQIILIILIAAYNCCQAQTSSSIGQQRDSVTFAASLKYQNPSFFKRLLLGKNYRTTWATLVTLPLFHMRQMGFTIKELGGGQQTKSLRLLDKEGREWALRTIDKDVEGALPPRLRNTLAERVVQDMISAAHPYAPLTITPLAEASGVIVAEPQFFFVPDDPAFGEHRNLFKNTMCMLEAREPTPDRSETKNTEDLLKALLKNSQTQVNGDAVLRARFLDMLIGDWDRHQDQWRWGFEKRANITYAYAIPRDRDQAYFYSRGLLVKFARVIALKHLVGFAKNTSKLKKLSAKSWNFDRHFLNDMDARDWSRAIQEFTAALPDSLIRSAVKKMPPEVYGLNGLEIERKLINRRNTLPKDALRYYRFIASQVVIRGTDAPERFVIRRAKDSINVQQFAGPDFSDKMYERTFHRKETYKISILGLDGADEFVEEGNNRSRIRLVLDGGAGTDRYELKSRRKTTILNTSLDAKNYLQVLKQDLRIKD